MSISLQFVFWGAAVAGLVAGGTGLLAQQPTTEVQLLGVARLPGTATDSSGLTDLIETDFPHNRFGGISGVDYDPLSGTFWAVSDRGPKDGAVPWTIRLHELSIKYVPGSSNSLTVKILRTLILRDAAGKPYTGSAKAIEQVADGSSRFDPEGIRVTADSFVISDEYGPHIRVFDRQGHWRADFEVPADFRVDNPHADEKLETAQNTRGRMTNRGLEGLAYTPEGQWVSLLQSPLIQDSRRKEDGGLEGLFCRMLVYNSAQKLTAQWIYPLEKPSLKLNEILAVNEHEFLVIERDGKIGSEATFKKIMKIDCSECSDVRERPQLPYDALPTEIRAARKSVWIDLLDSKFGLAGANFPEKIESLSWGPRLPDGRTTLIVAVDNDFIPENPTEFYLFAW